jgi:putative hydrolase of the HAD superfamily
MLDSGARWVLNIFINGELLSGSIRYLLFDLGGVLYHIEHQRTRRAFEQLQMPGADTTVVFSLLHADEVFGLYDAGQISSDEFRNHLRSLYKLQANDEQIDMAWNAMLIDVFPQTMPLLQAVCAKMPAGLLSNINQIHHRAIEYACLPIFDNLRDITMSYQVGMRKPQKEIFLHAAALAGLPVQEILFLDDTPANIEMAAQIGMQTMLIESSRPEWREQLLSIIDLS